jgi:ArsR family transcriptional regulator
MVSPFAGTKPMTRADANRLAAALKILADPSRLQILSVLQSAPGGVACGAEVAGQTGLTEPTVAHHLRTLTDAGFVQRGKRADRVHHRVRPAAIAAVADLLRLP